MCQNIQCDDFFVFTRFMRWKLNSAYMYLTNRQRHEVTNCRLGGRPVCVGRVGATVPGSVAPLACRPDRLAGAAGQPSWWRRRRRCRGPTLALAGLQAPAATLTA